MTQFLPPHLPYLGEKYFRRGKKIPKGFYRITVKAVVMNQNYEILILREGRYSDKTSEFYRDDGGLFDLPGWWVQYGDGFREWLFREIHEEIGLTETDVEISENPLYVQVTEVDDRYFDDPERDDFYPTLMMYYAVKFAHFDFHESPECTGYEWVNMSEYAKKPIWSHSAGLSRIFRIEDFPTDFLSST